MHYARQDVTIYCGRYIRFALLGTLLKNIFLGIIFERIYPSRVLYFHYNIILILASAFCNIRFLIVGKRYE